MDFLTGLGAGSTFVLVLLFASSLSGNFSCEVDELLLTAFLTGLGAGTALALVSLFDSGPSRSSARELVTESDPSFVGFFVRLEASGTGLVAMSFFG